MDGLGLGLFVWKRLPFEALASTLIPLGRKAHNRALESSSLPEATTEGQQAWIQYSGFSAIIRWRAVSVDEVIDKTHPTHPADDFRETNTHRSPKPLVGGCRPVPDLKEA